MTCDAPWHAGMAYACGWMQAALRAVGRNRSPVRLMWRAPGHDRRVLHEKPRLNYSGALRACGTPVELIREGLITRRIQVTRTHRRLTAMGTRKT
jgi:hypothetical protein